MKKLINAPDEVLTDALAGVKAAHPALNVDIEQRIITRAGGPTPGKVALVSGGGSGHEPLHGGYVGYGMLDAACAGEVFTSPVPDRILAAAKAVADYVRTSKVVVLKSGILGGRTLTAGQVESLARMPGGKNHAKAQVVGTIQGPLATTYSLLSAPLRDLCYVIQARAEQLQGGAEQPAQ